MGSLCGGGGGWGAGFEGFQGRIRTGTRCTLKNILSLSGEKLPMVKFS